MAVRIITDGSCDIELSEQEALGIDILPLRVSFGDEEYLEGVNLTRDEFYTKIRTASSLPKTTQISPADFEEKLAPYVAAGDEIVIVPISKELSGTYHSACIARESFDGAAIYVVDTCNVTFGLALFVRRAVALREQGASARQIAEKLEELRPKARLYALVSDLKYLRMGGRLSGAAAMAGSLLGIKPIIAIEDGKVINIDKVRGQAAALEKVVEYAEQAGLKGDVPCIFGHSDAPDLVQTLCELATERLGLTDTRLSGIGPVVGTHAGPGCTGVVFFAE